VPIAGQYGCVPESFLVEGAVAASGFVTICLTSGVCAVAAVGALPIVLSVVSTYYFDPFDYDCYPPVFAAPAPPVVRPQPNYRPTENPWAGPAIYTRPSNGPSPQSTPTPGPGPGHDPQPIPIPLPTPDDDRKQCRPSDVRIWMDTLRTQAVKSPSLDSKQYQVRVTGSNLEYKVDTVWADGIRPADCMLLDAKYVGGNFDKSPYNESPEIREDVLEMIWRNVDLELQKYQSAILNPANPVIGLTIITNEPRSIPFWTNRMIRNGIGNGRVSVVP